MKSKVLYSVQIAILLLALAFSAGCIEDTQNTCSAQVDNLLKADSSGWVYSNGYVTYQLSNGTIRVKFDGATDLIVQHETGPSVIYISGSNGARAAELAKKFGVSKMTPEDLGRSTNVKEGLLFMAISEITNIVSKKAPIIYEEEE
ncbi:MAG: hypothetical protein M0R32_11935 [Candidatus Cloacimonetes bacterium]|jgi:hypothetical protein|nr:hypothetical protein [Candidatus Cloacimonadota bacterium]